MAKVHGDRMHHILKLTPMPAPGMGVRKKIYSDLDVLQMDPDEYINHYNHERTHQGKRCQGRTPMQTFIDGKQYFAQKNLDNLAA
jgi:hypothetical protein